LYTIAASGSFDCAETKLTRAVGAVKALVRYLSSPEGGRGAMELLAKVATLHRDDGGRQQYIFHGILPYA
jgi:hypothetical protein